MKCWIVALASASALSSAMPLALRFFHSVRLATVPAGSSGVRTIAAGPARWGPGAGLEQLGVFADVRGIDLIGLVAPQLGAREVADLGGIDEADDVPGLMERQRDAQGDRRRSVRRRDVPAGADRDATLR